MPKLKAILSIDAVKTLLIILGYTFKGNSYKFKLRKDEKTASAVINKDCTIHDFGGDFHGDIFKLLTSYHDMTFVESVEWVKRELNYTDIVEFADKPTKKASNHMKQIIGRCQKFLGFGIIEHKQEALQIAPQWVWNEADADALKKIEELILFDSANKTLVIKIIDYDSKLISLKSRRIGDFGKWITATGTHPNKQCMYYITDAEAPVFVVEGHHDLPTGILLNSKLSHVAAFNVFMVPTVNYKSFSGEDMAILEDKNIVFLPDCDDNHDRSIATFRKLGEQIIGKAKSVKIIDLREFLKTHNCDNSGKIDLSETVMRWKQKSTHSFVNLLVEYTSKVATLEINQNTITSDTISQIDQYIQECTRIEKKINSLHRMLDSQYLTKNQVQILNQKVKSLQSELEEKQTEPNEFEDALEEEMTNLCLCPEDLATIELDFIFDRIIVKNEITMIAAPPATGKSLTTLAIANMGLKEEKVQKVIYFDLDNSMTTLADRGIIKVLKKWEGKLFYITFKINVGDQEIWNKIRKLQNTNLSNMLIIFDSAKNFLSSGKDRDKNKDVSPFLSQLKQLRNRGATIIFLHHTNKPNKNGTLQYAGSSAWNEDVSNAFLLHKNPHNGSFIFDPIKNRIGDIKKTAFQYMDEHLLVPADIIKATETADEEVIREHIIQFIETNEGKSTITYSNLIAHLGSAHRIHRDKANKVIQAGKGRHWIATKKKEQNNKDVYTLITSDIPDKSDK